MTTYWHGGSRIEGDELLPGEVTGMTRAAGDAVYVTTARSLAECYAATASGTAWVYEVEPVGSLTPVPPIFGGPTISFTCTRARILRRFTISEPRRAKLRAAVESYDPDAR